MSAVESPIIKAQPKLRFDLADIMLYDPVATNRSATRGALATLGFRKIATAYEIQDVVFRLKSSVVDLLILEARPDPKPVFQVVQEVRQGRMGPNPFTVILVTSWTLDDEIVRGVVNSGADDLARRPFSIGFLGARIKQLIEARKDFVVTSEYVGPDRRKEASRGPGQTHAVPNTLKLRMMDAADPVAVDSEVASGLAQGRQLLSIEKSRRSAFQICVLSRLMGDMIATPAPTERIHADLARVEALTAEIARRLGGTEFASVHQMCDPIAQAARAARAGQDLAQNVSMVGQLGATLYLTLCPGKDRDDADFELTQAIMAIRSRGRKE